MAVNSDGLPHQHSFKNFMQNANRSNGLHGQSSSSSSRWRTEFYPPYPLNQQEGLQNEYDAPRMSNMHRPRYFVHQNPPPYYSHNFATQNLSQAMYSPRFQLAYGFPSQRTFSPNRFHRPRFTPGLQPSTSVLSQGQHFQQAMQVSQEYGQQIQQIPGMYSQLQPAALSDYSQMPVVSSVQTALTVNTQQRYGQSTVNSPTMHVRRSVPTLPGHLQLLCDSSGAVSSNPSENISAHLQRPQQTLPEIQQEQHNSLDASAAIHSFLTEDSSTHAQRPQQTLLLENQQQQCSSSNTSANIHPIPPEHSGVHARRPQQTFLPGSQQKQYSLPNTSANIHRVPPELSSVYARRSQQTFLQGSHQQQYTSSEIVSSAYPVLSEHSSVHTQRPVHTVLSSHPQQQGTSSDTHLLPFSPTDNQMSGILPMIYSYLTGNVFNNIETSRINYSESSNAPLASAAGPVTTKALQQQDKEHQSIKTSNDFGVFKKPISAASHEMPRSSQVHTSSVSQAASYTPSLQQQSQAPVQQPYLTNSQGLHSISSSYESLGASLPSQSLYSKVDNSVPASLRQKRGHKRVYNENRSVTSDLATVNSGTSESHSLAAESEYITYQSGETELRARYGHGTVEQEQMSINNCVKKRQWYKYPETPVVRSFHSDIEAIQTDLTSYTASVKSVARVVMANPAEFSINCEGPSSCTCTTDIQTTDNQTNSLGDAHGDMKGKTGETGCQVVVEIGSGRLAMPIKQELPDHLSDPEANSSVVITMSIKDLTPSSVTSRSAIHGGYNCSSVTQGSYASNTSVTKDSPQSLQLTEASSYGICADRLLSDRNITLDHQNIVTADLETPIGRPDNLPLSEVTRQKLIHSYNSSDVSPATSSNIGRTFNCSLVNPEAVPHIHAADSQSMPSLIVDSGVMKDAGLSDTNSPDKVSAAGVLTGSSVQMSANVSNIHSEKDKSLEAKHQHCIFQARKPIIESRLNKKSNVGTSALLPGTLQNRRHTSACLIDSSNETYKPSADRLSTPRRSLDSTTSSQSKLKNKIRNTDAQNVSSQSKCITLDLTESEMARKQKSGDQKQPSARENSLSAKEKVFNMWKKGQVVENNQTSKRKHRNKKAKVTKITNLGQTATSQQTVKGLHLKNMTTNSSVGTKTRSDKTSQVKQKKAFSKTALIKENILSRSNNQRLASTICYVLIHGHKLLCLKSKTKDLILLCEFLCTCFPDKTKESLKDLINQILRIKKGVLEHPEEDKIVMFLKKQGYHSGSLIHTISVNDGVKIYHHVYGTETCTTALCVVQTPDPVNFVDLNVKDSATKFNKEVHIMEENSANKSTVTVDSVDGPEMSPRKTTEFSSSEHQKISVIEPTQVSAIETCQCVTDSHTVQSSDKSLKCRLCVDVATVISDSDETVAYGESSSEASDLDEGESILNNAFVIRWLPGTPKIGGFFNTLLGSIRSYKHNGDRYLAVDDLCRIFGSTKFLETIQKENIVLYSCCKDIESFLNKMDSNFPPLKSRHQSLVKKVDIGVHKIDDMVCFNSDSNRSSVLKRPLCIKPDCSEDCIPLKHPRLADDALLTDSDNPMTMKVEPSVMTMTLKLEPSVMMSESSWQPSCTDSMLERTEATGLITEDVQIKNKNGEIPAITKSISSRLTSCLVKEHCLNSSGDCLVVDKCVNNSKKLFQNSETALIYKTYIPIDISSSVDTDSCCRNTDSEFDHSVIRQHDLLSPDSDRSTFSPGEQSTLIFYDHNPGELPTSCQKQMLNQCSWNSHIQDPLLESCEDLHTLSKDIVDRCLTPQVQTLVKLPGELEAEKTSSNSYVETADRTLMKNTLSERNTSVDSNSAVCTEPHISHGGCENIGSQVANTQSILNCENDSSQGADKQNNLNDFENICSQGVNMLSDLSGIEKSPIQSKLCSDSLPKDASGRNDLSVTQMVNMEANFLDTVQEHTTEDDIPEYELIILHADQSDSISVTDNAHIVGNLTHDGCDAVSICDEKCSGKVVDVPPYGKLSSEQKVLQPNTQLIDLASYLEKKTSYSLPSSGQFRRCFDDMDIFTTRSSSMIVPSSYKQAYNKLWRHYITVLGDNSKLTKKCKYYEDFIGAMTETWGPT